MTADSTVETEPAPTSSNCRMQGCHGFALFGTLSMTYLTVVKELVLYQNEHHNGWAAVHRLTMRGYYPLLILNMIWLLWLIWQRKTDRRPPLLLSLAIVVFFINVALFSANNVANLLSGHPLHGLHHGIGW